MKNLMLLIIFSFLFLEGCATEVDLQKQGGIPMSTSEIKQKFTENSLVGVTGSGYQVTWFLRKDGGIIGVNGTGANRNARDSGVWEVTEESGFCTQWTQWGDGKKQCSKKIYMIGDQIKMCRADGHCSSGGFVGIS